MTTKEANVYIVDIGRSMGECHNGRQQTDLEWAMTWIWDKITTDVATDRKTLLQSVVAFRSDVSKNSLCGNDPSYNNIEVLQELQQFLLPQLKDMNKAVKTSSTDRGDAFSAIVVAMQMIELTCKHLKYDKRITLVTNGLGQYDAADLDDIADKMKADKIELTILGVDFDDTNYPFKEEDKPLAKRRNEDALRGFAAKCDGTFATLAEAVDALGTPRPKETRPIHSYRGHLTLGNPVPGSNGECEDTTMVIEVERYPRTMIRRPPTASNFVMTKPDDKNGNGPVDVQMSGMNDRSDDQGVEAVRNNIKYLISEKDSSGNNIEVDRDNLARGYEYGKTAVHISELDEGVTKFETSPSLEIIGFIPSENYDRYMSMSATNVIIAQRSSSKSVMALSSFIHALHELESFAVAKLVTKEGKDPVLEILAPLIDVDFECLIDVQLPFAEDVRLYKFPRLDKVVTVGGTELKEHRYLPDHRLQAAMDAYVDAMDLSDFEADDGEKGEYARMEETYSPVLHRIDQAVRWRAVHPEEPIPPPYEILTRLSQPPQKLREQTAQHLKTLEQAADVKKVPPKIAGRRKRETIKPISGLDVDALLSGSKDGIHVDPRNPIPSYKQLLQNPPEISDALKEGTEQFATIIEKRIKESYGDAQHDMALQELREMRKELVDMDDPGMWNEMIRRFKKKLLGGDLGDGAGEMWWKIRKDKLGLIEGEMPDGGQVTADEASEFLLGGALSAMPLR